MNNQSGEEFLRQLGPNEKLDLEALAHKWAQAEFADYAPRLSFSRPDFAAWFTIETRGDRGKTFYNRPDKKALARFDL